MFLLVATVAISFAYLLLKLICDKHFGYWERLNVNYIPSTYFLGNIKEILTYSRCFGEHFKCLYNHPCAKNAPIVGIHLLHNHALLIRDPALIKRILINDFSSFRSRFEASDPVNDAMGSLNLFFAKYDVWKEIHNLFSPFFTQARVKQMYPLVREVALKLEEHLSIYHFDETTNNSAMIEVKEMSALFTTDVISSIAFGIDAKSLENPRAKFRYMCIEVNCPRFKRVLHFFTMFFFPQFATSIGTRLYSKDYEEFMRQSIEDIMVERENSGHCRHDLIDIFIQLKQRNASSLQSIINRKDFFVAQAAFLLLAGFDTSSSTIAF